MSGILGIWNTDGQPVAEGLLQRMNARMTHRGPDGSALLRCGNAGFAFQQLKVMPESAHETQPWRTTTGSIVLFDGRLDNREELLSELRPRHALENDSPDVMLAGAAYDTFGNEFAEKLDGDFAIAIFDPAKSVLFLARDLMGPRPLFYCRVGSTFLFATEIKALLVHPLVKTEPNNVALAEYFYRYFDYSDQSRTFFKGISTVASGELVVVSPESTTKRNFTDFDPSHEIRFKNDRDYVDAYREHFLAAVKRRLRSSFPVACMASGGQDSSAVFCAALTMKREAPGSFADCFGIAAVPESPEVNEISYQRTIEDMYGVELLKIPLQDIRTMADSKNDLYYREAPFMHWRDWTQIWRQSRDRGARVLISGFFGDQILLSAQYYLDLVRSFRWGTTKRHFDVYSNFYHWASRAEHRRNLWGIAKGYAIPPVLRPSYHWFKRRLRRPFSPLLGFSAEFAAVASKLERTARPLPLPRGTAHARGIYNFARSKHPSIRTSIDALWESQYQIETTYPFRDRDLVAFLMAIPGEKVFLQGIPRGIHCEAMRGILPEEIRTRRTKADFSRIARQSAVVDLEIFAADLAHSTALRLGYLKPLEELRQDVASLKKWLDADPDASSSWVTQDIIWLDAWLSVFFSDFSQPLC